MTTTIYGELSTPQLARLLAPLLGESGGSQPGVAILERARPVYESTAPAEIVTVETEEQGIVRILCKYAGTTAIPTSDHRRGVDYEQRIYADVLSMLSIPTVRYYGAFTHPTTGFTGLVLEYLETAARLNRTTNEKAPASAARWIGAFHSQAELLARGPTNSWVTAYDRDYYIAWAQRAGQMALLHSGSLPWFGEVVRRFVGSADSLVAAPQTIIHGEYYPMNILESEGDIYPIDWESAAMGPGEIDLASLTDGWDPPTTQECEAAYLDARWPGEQPDFPATLIALARLYLQFRWLGDRPEWTTSPEAEWRFDSARRIADDLGWL